MELIWGPDFAALAEVARSVFTRFSPLRDEPDETQFGLEGLYAALAELDWFRVTDPADTDPDSAALGSVAALHVELGRALVDAPLLAAFECRELALRSGHPQGAAWPTRSAAALCAPHRCCPHARLAAGLPEPHCSSHTPSEPTGSWWALPKCWPSLRQTTRS